MNKSKNEKELIWYPSGCDLLDLVVGGEQGLGFFGGHIINIAGDWSSGKTFLACEIIAKAYYTFGDKLKWAYDDCESGFTHDTERLYGFEIMPFEENKRWHSNTVEDLYGNCRSFFENIKEDEFGIYIVDSLDGLTSEEIEERGNDRYAAFKKGKDFNKGSYMTGKAKFLSQEFFPKLAGLLEKSNSLLIIISQLRSMIGSYYPVSDTSVGRALRFYCKTILWLTSLSDIEKKGRVMGHIIKIYAKKSKTSRPYRECIFPLLFDYGIDNTGANIDFLYDLRDKKGNLKDITLFWDEQEKKIDLSYENLKGFIDDQKFNDVYEDNDKLFKGMRGQNKINAIYNWLCEQGFAQILSETFGQGKKREELIRFIEENNLQSELRNKVRNKWESIENEIRIDRQSKY